MRSAGSRLILLLCVACLASAACASSKAPGAAGTWAGNAPAAGDAGRSIRLELRSDGTATMTTESHGKEASITDLGTWRQDGGEVKFQIEGAGGAKSGEPMTWERKGASLKPKSWNKSLYGAAGVILMLSGEDTPK